MHGHPRVRTQQGIVEVAYGGATPSSAASRTPSPRSVRCVSRLPLPVAAWEGVRPAVEFGPPPPQSGPGPQADPSPDTDWLTLNACTPGPRHDGVAGVGVAVLRRLGMAGTAADPMTDPTAPADAGIVVVIVQCRMGAEGFALLDGAPSNRGLLDQIAALEWVQHNIANFGGDPSRVTVAGVSGGAGSVAALLAVPRARSLFQRAVTQSVPGLHCTPALAEEVTATLANRLGVPPPAQGSLLSLRSGWLTRSPRCARKCPPIANAGAAWLTWASSSAQLSMENSSTRPRGPPSPKVVPKGSISSSAILVTNSDSSAS